LDDYWLSNDGDAEGIRVSNNGYVGIGTGSPTAPLHVEGDVRIGANGYIDDDATVGGDVDDWIRLNGYVEVKTNSDDHGLVIRDKDNNDYAAITQKNGWSYLSDNGVSGSYFLRGNDADVEIRGDLDVKGSDVYDSSGEIRVSGEDDVFITMDYNGDDNDSRAIRFGKNSMTAPTELMRLTETGRLGVGHSSPRANIHIYGNSASGFVPAGLGAAAGPELAFSRGGFANPGASIQMIDYNGYSSGLCFNVHRGVNYGGGGTFADNWPTDVVQAMTIRNNGNVGIGTADPAKLLHVAESSGGSIMVSRNDANTNLGEVLGELVFDSSDDTTPSTVDGSAVIRATASENHGNSNKGGELLFLTKQSGNGANSAATERMRITNNGRVGIGTTTPLAQLHTKGSVRLEGLSGSGSRMVVADANGDLSTQAIPGGSGGASAYGVNGTGTQNTSSSSFSNINSMSLNLTAGTYILQFNAEVTSNNSSTLAEFLFFANGATVSASARTIEPDNAENKTVTVTCVVTVSSTQTVTTQFRKSSGSGSITVANRCFTAIRL